jgi:hypothetical protein
MRRRVVAGGLFTVGILLSVPLLAAERSTLLPVEADTLLLEPGKSVGCLHRPFVLARTLELRQDERLLVEGVDYALDADAGCFTLFAPDSAGSGRRLTALYQVLPLRLEGTYYLREDPHRRQAAAVASGQPADPPPAGFTSAADVSDLDISGSKTFGIEMGNRSDLKLQQSLDLRLTGRVSKDVNLLAILSDQDIPFQPDGSTAELQDLDRILVRLESPRAGASLGDVSLTASGLSFLDLHRDVEGFSGNASLGGAKAQGAIASAKGEFASREFFGEEGKQGPYRLTDRTGNTDIVIVAGSEKIWMDGVLLHRGEEEDYVIDYSLGEITFTSRRVVTATSTISVDYQYATARYQRHITFLNGEDKLGSFGTLKATYYSEGDNADHPLGGELSQSEIDQLAAEGDSARVPCNTRYVGANQGDYDLIVDAATGKQIYVFVDGAGDYTVQFVDVGTGKGEYLPRADSTGVRTTYVFVGEGNGQFIPCRDLPPPENRRITDLHWEAAGKGGRLAAEGAFSQTDGNVLSSLDDGNNQGAAFTAEGEARSVALGHAIHLTPQFQWRHVGESFESPARLRSAFFGRDWNLTGTEEIRAEDLAQGGATLDLGGKLRWSATGGRLALADTFTAIRQEQVVTVNTRWVTGNAAWNTVREDVGPATGAMDRWGGEVLLGRFRVAPRFRGLDETRERPAGDGERHRDWEAALVLPAGQGPFRAEIGVGRRLDDSLRTSADDFTQVRDTKRGFSEVEGRWRTLTVLMRYEARGVEVPGSDVERRDTGRLDVRHQALRGAWSGLLSMDVGTVGLRQRTKSIVPDSTGYFDQFGNYIGAGGGYDVQFGPPGDEVLSGRVDLSTRFRWTPPGEEIKVAPVLRAVAWEAFLNVNESSSLPLVEPRYFLNPGSYLDPATTLDGRLSLQQSLDLFPSHRQLGFRIRNEVHETLVRNASVTADSLVERHLEKTLVGTLRANPTPAWDAELEGSLGSRDEEVHTGVAASYLQNTALHAATLRGGRRLEAGRHRGRLSVEGTYSEEVGANKEARGWTVRPKAQWSVTDRGRLDVQFAYTDLLSSTGFTGILGPGASQLVAGWRMDVVSEVRIHKGIVLTGVVRMDHPAGLAEVTTGRMEVRGTF